MRNEGVRAELEYSSKEYDEELEAESNPASVDETTPALRIGSPSARRLGGRVVGFEGVRDKTLFRIKRESDERRCWERNRRTYNGGDKGVNLPPFLVAYLGRNEVRQPLYLSSGFRGS